MTSLMDSLGQFVTPDTVGKIAGMVGVDPKLAQQGMDMAGPLLLGATGRKMATPEGAAGVTQVLGSLDTDSMLGSLQKGDMGGMLGSLGSVLGGMGGTAGAANDPGSALVNQLLGSGGPAVTGFVREKFGFDIGPFLPIAAPLIAGVLSRAMKSGNLDAGGVSKLITSENESFAKANPTLATELNTALDLGEQLDATVTAKRAAYSSEDWLRLFKGPFIAGLAVMAASPSGALGGVKEVTAMLNVVTSSVKDAAPGSLLALLKQEFADHKDELLQVVTADLKSAGFGDVVSVAVGLCKNALTTVRAAGDAGDAAAYGTLLMDVATGVANASKEGGFLGIGGKVVSDKEQAALDALKAALA